MKLPNLMEESLIRNLKSAIWRMIVRLNKHTYDEPMNEFARGAEYAREFDAVAEERLKEVISDSYSETTLVVEDSEDTYTPSNIMRPEDLDYSTSALFSWHSLTNKKDYSIHGSWVAPFLYHIYQGDKIMAIKGLRSANPDMPLLEAKNAVCDLFKKS